MPVLAEPVNDRRVTRYNVWDDVAMRKLACAVLFQAVKDAQVMRGIDTFTARMFLLGGEGLREWCDLAGVSYSGVASYAKARWEDSADVRASIAGEETTQAASVPDEARGVVENPERRAGVEGHDRRTTRVVDTVVQKPAPTVGETTPGWLYDTLR